MSTFNTFKQAVRDHLHIMQQGQLFEVDLDKDLLWSTYLNSFPDGANPIYRERTEHDCSACRQFIKAIGHVVSIVDNQIVSVWDLNVGGIYQPVCDALSGLVKTCELRDVFLTDATKIGVDENFVNREDGSIHRYEHLFCEVSPQHRRRHDRIATEQAVARTNYDSLLRAMNEITLDSANIVLELIEQGGLYRGNEHKEVVQLFIQLKQEFDALSCGRDLWVWQKSLVYKNRVRFRSSVIGTLLLDLSGRVELDRAVASFESKVAPHNYRRSSAPITNGMVAKAEEKIKALGLEDALHRRTAVFDDINVNDVLFVDKPSYSEGSVFDELGGDIKQKKPSSSKIESVTIDTFMDSILPKADSLELFIENSHANNFVTLLAPKFQTGKNLFSWENNFSWAYRGDVTDSIKERVKKAGGNVDAYCRVSLAWFNTDDLDLHAFEPHSRGKRHIFYGNKRGNGHLDVDMNVSLPVRDAVENICWLKRSDMEEGLYQIQVHNFTKRENSDVGFTLEFAFGNEMKTFHYNSAVRERDYVNALSFKYTKKDGIKIIDSIPGTESSRSIYGLSTGQFHRVSALMLSPNYWGDYKSGNKHYFFMLHDCKSDDNVRGFYNEFLRSELIEHRKVFEVLGSKLNAEKIPGELSGLGFSETRRAEILCRVSGSFNRTIKIVF